MDIITGKLGQMIYCIIIIGGHGIFTMPLYQVEIFNKLINFLHKRINCLKTLLTSVKTILSGNLLKKGENLNILDTNQFRDITKECNI